MVVGTSKDDDDETDGTASEFETEETPGRRAASEGAGGGGMSCVSVSMRGTGPRPEAALCALFTAGKAGGTSLSSPWTVSASSLSSTAGGEVSMEGAALGFCAYSQLLR